MATVKKGVLTATGEWWKHLRSKKRVFWKSERQAVRRFVRRETELDVREDRKASRPDSD